ncbi:RDD family protein [Labilibaculum sp. K2S]|uniref:RDD family protein n=1 Tax=Labilibaculum sp. K2S TaxID=3056386 RepID=UPI0025A40047|nr:RDD family protein [Labilibaculum sp. K2S]MDM8160833.1 RDD family protein [Labilibaculum sp. K2S]
MRQLNTLITTLILIGLSFLILSILENFVFINIQNLEYPDFNYRLTYSLIFGFIAGISIIKNREIKWNDLLIIISLVIAGFIIDVLLILKISQYQISPNVISSMTLNFKMVYYLPIYPFIIILFVRIFKILNIHSLVNRLPVFIENKKINIARCFAFLFDWFIVIIIGLILNKFLIILWFPVEILLVNFAYRLILETSLSKTFGKIIFGIMIIRMDNGNPTLKDILIRNLSRLTIFYWVPILNDKIGLHDRLSKTRIIKNALKSSRQVTVY